MGRGQGQGNVEKHGVSFEEAITALADPRAIEALDLVAPDRHITIGFSALLRLLFVVHTESAPAGRTRIDWRAEAAP